MYYMPITNNMKTQVQMTKSSETLLSRFLQIREQTEKLCDPLLTEDYVIQTMASTSPPKWHLAHTSWFFETLILQPYLSAYRVFDQRFITLFNSYYETIGPQHPRPERGLLSRPTVKQVYEYRCYINEQIERLLYSVTSEHANIVHTLLTLGLHHEQQHQELLLMDIKHAFAYNPLHPQYRELDIDCGKDILPLSWQSFEGGIYSIGTSGEEFAYDNESPQHKVFLSPFKLASRLVTNLEYLEFIEAGAYQKAYLWLSDGWRTVQEQGWTAPLYWQKVDGEWVYQTLTGSRKVDPATPVAHISFYEAEAYARWRGARLPTEAEWEIAAISCPLEGNFLESDLLHPKATIGQYSMAQMFGDLWEWTQSSYAPYPGYRPASGPLGEYNGKFMSGQMVLRGGSCVTPENHNRPTYRNFYYPDERWMFSGIRLAGDIM